MTNERDYIDRPLYVDQILAYSDTRLVKLLTGVRRCGKSTILRMVQNRLEEKGAVAAGTADGLKTFSPLVRREDAALRETEDFLGRVYHGSLRMMVSSLTRRQALPQEEIDGLYALLREMEAKQSD